MALRLLLFRVLVNLDKDFLHIVFFYRKKLNLSSFFSFKTKQREEVISELISNVNQISVFALRLYAHFEYPLQALILSIFYILSALIFTPLYKHIITRDINIQY